MPYITHKSVFKCIKQAEKRREHNRIIKGTIRAVLKAFRNEKSLDATLARLSFRVAGANSAEKAKFAGARMFSIIDKANKKGIIHKHKAARHKAQISRWMTSVTVK